MMAGESVEVIAKVNLRSTVDNVVCERKMTDKGGWNIYCNENLVAQLVILINPREGVDGHGN